MTRPLLVHIGYHKTATTWMQRVLFRPERGYRQIMSHGEVFETIVHPHGLTFDSSHAKSLISARTGPDEATSVDVISSEILSGHPFYGGRESDQYAIRLHAVAPDALILISIREQFSAMTSIYNQYLARGGTMSPSAFFAEKPVVGYFSFSPEHLQYHRLVGLYRDIFGPDHVLVITKETFDKQPVEVTDRIATFSRNTKNKGLSPADSKRIGESNPEYVVSLVRRINHFRRGAVNPAPLLNLGVVSRLLLGGTSTLARRKSIMQILGRAKPVTSVVTSRFRGRFAESNRALKAMLGDQIDLGRYELDD